MKGPMKILLAIYHRIRRGDFGTASWKKKFAYFGEGTTIFWPAIISLGRGDFFISDNTCIKKYSRLENYYGEDENDVSITIGANCSIGYYFSILNASKVTIGDNVLIASNVLITSENHTIDIESNLEYKDQPLMTSPVNIGDGCWIGEKVVILPGVSIGKKCVIGAASVVTKSIPDYCIAVGNPAKIIKKYNFNTHSWESV